MSDLSVLAQRYETAAGLSQAISEAVIALKKVHQGLPGADSLAPEAVETSRERLANVTAALAALLDPASNDIDIPDSSQVTGSLVVRLQAAQQGNLTSFAEDLQQASRRLRCAPAKLSPRDFALLDELAAAADAETSHVFRRLMRV